jgi:hypothetical protein
MPDDRWDDVAHQWTSVGDHFAELGKRFKERYDAAEGGRREGGTSDFDRAMKDAADAVDRAMDALRGSLQSDALRDEAEAAFRAVGDAIGATIHTAAGEVRRVVGDRRPGDGDDEGGDDA